MELWYLSGKVRGLRDARLATAFPVRNDASVSLVELAATIEDKSILAYAWMAIESNYNIIVFCNGESNGFVDALSAFIPNYHLVLELSSLRDPLDRRMNFHSARRIPYGFMPARIISKNREISRLFSMSKYGTSFLAQLNGDFSNKSIVRKLKKSPFSIKDNQISALDISISIKSHAIKAMTEYKWLERAETKSYNRFENMRMIEHGRMSRHSLENSKVMANYMRLNLVNMQEAIRELERRAEFLGTLVEKAANGTAHGIESYYETK